jgi:release factor glutamine methyltransferase
MKTLQVILQDTAGYLARNGVESARVEAEWLLAHALDCGRLDLYVQFERPLAEAELAAIRPLLKRRAGGEPLQYVIGTAPFIKRELLVGPGVLIPRPETEQLVEIASKHDLPDGPILDLCTGSGAILFGLCDLLAAGSNALPEMIGVDLSEDALAWARRNLEKTPEANICFLQGDLYAPVSGRQFALITSNPPYVTNGEMAELPREVREHEPAMALAAGDDGLDVYRRIFAGAADHLLPDGHLLCEIGETQGPALLKLSPPNLRNPQIIKDYAGKPRFFHARK